MMLPPRALFVHLAQRRARGEERAVEMDCQHLLPFREFEFVDRRHDLDAGIADEDVDAAERGDRLRHAGFDFGFTRDIHRHAERLAADFRDLRRGSVRHPRD